MIIEKIQNFLGIAKKTSPKAKKSTNIEFKNEIKTFMSESFNVDDQKLLEHFFARLYKVDNFFKYTNLYSFIIAERKKEETVAGTFFRSGRINMIKLIKQYNSKAPAKFKKMFLLNTYLHESTHKLQFDTYLSYKDRRDNGKKCSAYQKILNYEFSDKAQKPQYDFKLCEIDARMESVNRFCELLKSNTIAFHPMYIVEPIIAILKNTAVLTNLDNKQMYFNSEYRYSAGDTIPNRKKFDEVNFDIDGYAKLYKNFLANIENKKGDFEISEAKEIFENEQLLNEFKEEFNQKLEVFKKNMLMLYSLARKTYNPSKYHSRLLNEHYKTEQGIEEFKEDYQFYMFKMMKVEYFNLYVEDELEN